MQQLRHRRQQNTGTSLIEILVVLVILVFGILSVIRLFPGGFLAVQSAQNSTFADRLAQANLQTLTKFSAGLPDGIYVPSLDPNSGDLQTDANGDILLDPNWFPDDIADDYPNVNSVAPGANDINKARYISNETITIPAAHTYVDPATMASTFGAVHILNFGPMFFNNAVQYGDATYPNYLKVTSTPWTAQTADSRPSSAQTFAVPNQPPTNTPATPVDNPLEELTPGQPAYLVDYNAGAIALAPPPPVVTNAATNSGYPRNFTFTLLLTQIVQAANGTTTPTTYRVTLSVPPPNAGDNPQGPQNNSATVYEGGWLRLSDPNYPNYITKVVNTANGASSSTLPLNAIAYNTDGTVNSRTYWAVGSTVLTRQFFDLGRTGTSSQFSSDPYEYKMLTANVGGGTSNANMGVIVFNPLAAGKNGTAPLQARLSYLVYDWHILHEDHDLSESGGGTIRLALNNLKKVGDVQVDNTIYNGLFGGATNAGDIALLDTDTGDVTLLAEGANNVFDSDNTTGTASNTQFDVSYRNGRFTLPPSYLYVDGVDSSQGLAHTHVRVFYEADADWAVAVEKAATTYQRSLNDQIGPSTLAGSGLGQINTTPNQYAIQGTTIYFPKCDAGKTVELDNVIYYVAGTNSGQFVQKQLGNQDVVLPSSTTLMSGVDVVSVALPIPAADANSGLSGLTMTVRGTSARAMVIWKERGQWKQRTVDTLLTAAPTQSVIQ